MNIKLIFEWFLNDGLIILLIFLGMFLAVKLSNYFIRKHFDRLLINSKNYEETEKRNNTLKSIVNSLAEIFIIISGLLMILYKLGIDVRPVLAAAGVLGIAVGFGAQRFVEDIITGIIILFEDQIRVGDVVQVAGKGGLVERFDLKMVVLRDLAGNVHYIRNGKIDIITNMTKDFSRYVFDIGVAYREDVEQVISIIKQVDEQMRNEDSFKNIILEPIEVLGLDRFENSAVIVRARTTTKPIKQWEVARAFNLRLKKKFDELNIEIPFPHRTLYMGQYKDGSSPILNINVDK